MGKIQKLINLAEKTSDLLYHNTSYTGLMSIIKNNTLGTTRTISLTRDPDYKFYEFGEQIVLDGKKLKAQYDIRPYADPGMVTPGNPDPESEERVYNGPIKHVDRYIISIRLSTKSKIMLKNELEASKQWIKRYDNDRDFKDDMDALVQVDKNSGGMFSSFTKASYEKSIELLDKILKLSKN